MKTLREVYGTEHVSGLRPKLRRQVLRQMVKRLLLDETQLMIALGLVVDLRNEVWRELYAAGPDEVKQHPMLAGKARTVARADRFFAKHGQGWKP